MELQTAIGESEIFQQMLQKVSMLAKINRPILILGERGSGKELVASRLHYHSHRWDKPYVAINCAALPESLLDAELFGAERGSYTGANQTRIGRIERANEGTLFLDELATASLSIQEKLLRALEYGEIERVGSQHPIQVDVRIVAATNADLQDRVDKGLILPDLLDRLCFDVVHVPPLRHREEDVLLLTEFYTRKIAVELGFSFPLLWSNTAKEELCQYKWPGNVRELKSTVERSVFYHGDNEKKISNVIFQPIKLKIQEEHQQTANQIIEAQIIKEFNFYEKVQAYEKDLLKKALSKNNFHQKETAKFLKLTYHQLRGLVKKYKLNLKEISWK